MPALANENKGYYAINEFGEPSLVRSEGNLYSAVYNGNKYDEYGHLIGEEELDRPLFAAIETRGPNMGFMDGDILVQQDDWLLWRSSGLSDLELEPQPDADHHFKVLRFNEETKDYDVVEVNIPEGDARVKNITYVKFYMTKAEEERIYDVMSEKIYQHVFEFIPVENGALYERGLHSPALVFAINDWDMSNHFGGEKDSLMNIIRKKRDEVKHIMLYDEELEQVRTYKVDSDTLGITLKSYEVKPRYYNLLLREMLKHKNSVSSQTDSM